MVLQARLSEMQASGARQRRKNEAKKWKTETVAFLLSVCPAIRKLTQPDL
jgi:hypothetical protein